MSSYPFQIWFTGTVALSMIYTWLYNSTEGSLFVVTLFHVFTNTFGVLLPGVSVVVLSLLYVLFALLLVAVFGKENLARYGRVRAG